MADGPTIREFEDRDVPAVLDVLRAALGEPPGLQRTPELFHWKHRDNPFGRSLMLIAELDGRVAGFRAFMRWRLKTPSGAVLRCVRAVDTATHPDFQRRGVFSALTEACVAKATTEGVELVFNTPNEKSGAGYLKMGWQRVGPVGVMLRPRFGLLSRRSQSWDTDGSTRTELERHITDGALDLLAVRPGTGLRTPRDRDYLAWRFASHPTARYVSAMAEDGIALGRLTMRSGRRELVVSDVGGSGAATAIRDLVRRHKPDYAVGWFSVGSPERAAAVRSGLLPLPRMTALTLIARPLQPLEASLSSMSDWDLALSDLELL